MSRGGGAVALASPAKINLFLEILRRRPDGYHAISTVFQEVTLHDTLRVRVRTTDGLSLNTDSPALRGDDSNLVLRAARAFKERAPGTPGFDFDLEKRIPIGAGLGGGSSNAAAALLACERLSGVRPTPSLFSLAKTLGADVPFFLQGGLASAGGVGERLAHWRLPGRRVYSFVLVFPRVFSSTPAAYRALQFPLTNRRSRLKLMRALKAEEPPEVWSPWMFNRLEEAVFPRLRPVEQAKKALLRAGCLNALMSGSGSSVFGVVKNPAQGRQVLRSLRGEAWDFWLVSSAPGRDRFEWRANKARPHGNYGNSGFTPR